MKLHYLFPSGIRNIFWLPGKVNILASKVCVWQGCILSPLLLNLCINDLPSTFENTLSDSFVLPNDAELNPLLYADDLITIQTGLQNCLDKLSSYCTSWMMKISPKKNGLSETCQEKCWASLSHRWSNYWISNLLIRKFLSVTWTSQRKSMPVLARHDIRISAIRWSPLFWNIIEWNMGCVCQTRFLRPGTARKSKRHISNIANVYKR